MQDDPSKRIDPEHPVMRMIAAIFDGATEFGLSNAEVKETCEGVLADADPNGPIASLMINALAQRVQAKGLDESAFRRHAEDRTTPLMHEAQDELGIERTD